MVLPASGQRFTFFGGDSSAVEIYTIANDGSAEGDETLTVSLAGAVSTGAPTYTIDTPSTVTVIIRGTDSAPSFGIWMVAAKTFTAGMPIAEFTVPAASGLPAGLRFDATGTDTPGCPGPEARKVCGTPSAVTSGAQTVTITATDADSNPATLTEATLNGATLTVTLIGPTFAGGLSASSATPDSSGGSQTHGRYAWRHTTSISPK